MLMHDVRFAFRLLRRDRGFAATAIFVLAIGIGINNMFFTILHAHTMRGLPIANADRIVYITTFDDRSPDRAVSHAEFDVIRRSTRQLEAVAAFTSAPVTIAGDAHAAERVDATFVSASAFELIGAAPLAGRSFAADDDREGAAAVAMLGDRLWRSRYGSDPSAIGRSLVINGAPATIVGIVREASGFPSGADVWLPLAHAPRLAAQPREARVLRLVGRMRNDADLNAVRGEIDGIVNRLMQQSTGVDRSLRPRVIPINERYFGRLGDPAWRAFIAASVLVALISFANVANLMLTRAHRRARELAIRSSLGAGRRRLLRQLLVEGVLLAVAGGAAGAVVSVAGVRVFSSAIPERVLPYWVHYSVDGRVIAALIVVSMAAVLLFALLPAVRASRPDVNGLLKSGPIAGERAAQRWATGFLVAEYALAVVLLAQVVVSFRAGVPQVRSDHTVDTRAVVTATVSIPAARYAVVSERVALLGDLDRRIRGIAGVTSVSFATFAPLTGAEELRLQNAAGEVTGAVRSIAIDRGYFATLDVPVVRGREFGSDDTATGSRTAIVNERFGQRFLGGRDPIGQQIVLAERGGAAAPLTIVGVAADVRQRPFPEPDPIVYLPYRQTAPPNVIVLVRSGLDPSALVPLLRQAVLAADPGLPIYRVQTMAEVVRNAQWNARMSHRLILLITFIAVVLSAAGLYAVTAHGVAQRRREIGIRMALGASPRQVLRLIMRRVSLQLGLGFGAGVLCTLGWQRLFSSGRIDLSIVEPGALAAIALTLAIAASIACAVPARRAIRLDPVAAIRGE